MNVSNIVNYVKFKKKLILKIPVPTDGKPINYFQLLADKFFNLPVKEINNYAELSEQKINHPIPHLSWKPVTKDEFCMFLGFVLHMGKIKLNRIKDYFGVPII